MATDDLNAGQPVRPQLGLWDTVSIIVGIVVGTSIFRASATVFDSAGGAWWAMALWTAGGVLAWCGATCYAELATTYPRDGGDYEYLNRAFGPWCGFLFAWAQLTTIISGNIGIMAYVFADYARHVVPAAAQHMLGFTMAPIISLAVLNAVGIVAGKTTQNLLTGTKVVGLAGLILAGLVATGTTGTTGAPLPAGAGREHALDSKSNIGLALVFVLYAYGGWAHAAYVAAEVRDQHRNLPRALLLGIAGITLTYLAVNATYLHALGFEAARHSTTPAADVLVQVVGSTGGRVVSMLVMLSALGAMNGMILTATRIYAVWGADYPALRSLGKWSSRRGAPLTAIAVQTVAAVTLVFLVGTSAGRWLFDASLRCLGLAGLPWEKYSGGFEMLVAGSAPVYWTLSLLTGVAVLVLRRRDRSSARPYSMPLFPWPAIVFCATCVFMLRASLDYARGLVLLGLVPLVVGGVVWLLVRPRAPAVRR